MSRIGSVIKMVYGDKVKSAPEVETRKCSDGIWKEGKAGIKKIFVSRRTYVILGYFFLAIAVLGLLFESIYQFNLLTSSVVAAQARKGDLDKELQRRENLIPNLVRAAQQYAMHEQFIFKYVSDARTTLKVMKNTAAGNNLPVGELSGALSRLVALAEQYPDLKATQPIQDLIKEASETENRVAEAKKDYNKAAEIYNQARTVFPGNLFAFVYRFMEIPYIGTEESLGVPKIDLNMVLERAASRGNSSINMPSAPAEDLIRQNGKKKGKRSRK